METAIIVRAAAHVGPTVEPGSGVHHVPLGVWLQGPLDVEILERSLTKLCGMKVLRRASHQRHRARSVSQGPEPFHLQQIDLTEFQAGLRDQEIKRLLHEELGARFDLQSGPGLMIRLSDAAHVLFLTMHHIVAEGGGLLLGEISALYQAYSQNQPSRKAAVDQYGDYSACSVSCRVKHWKPN